MVGHQISCFSCPIRHGTSWCLWFSKSKPKASGRRIFIIGKWLLSQNPNHQELQRQTTSGTPARWRNCTANCQSQLSKALLKSREVFPRDGWQLEELKLAYHHVAWNSSWQDFCFFFPILTGRFCPKKKNKTGFISFCRWWHDTMFCWLFLIDHYSPDNWWFTNK